MKVAGFGFRGGASVASLRAALTAAGGGAGLAGLATAEDKAGAPAIQALAAEMALPLHAVPLAMLTAQNAAGSDKVPVRYGAKSVAEASSLAAAGPGARLLVARSISADGMATAAIAEGDD